MIQDCPVSSWIALLMHAWGAGAGRKANKQKIGNVRLSVSDVVRNGKIRDSWALQASLLLLRGFPVGLHANPDACMHLAQPLCPIVPPCRHFCEDTSVRTVNQGRAGNRLFYPRARACIW